MSIVRILCYNIHGGYDTKGYRDLQRVNALMEDLDIDIGVFQEMETRPSFGGQRDDIDVLAGPERPHRMPAPTKREGEGWYGNFIVSRYPIIRALVHDLEKEHQVMEPRNAVDTLIDTPKGLLRIIGTHLSLSSVMRWWEINNLIKLVNEAEAESKCPVFFMGDFNEWSWPSKLIRHLNKIMIPFPCGKTFPSRFPLFRLDRVWCDDPNVDVTVRALKRSNVRTLSDHLPVLIEIKNIS